MFTKIKTRLSAEKGFTLIELIVVIAIIGVLAAIAVPKFTSSTDSAAKAKIQADLRTLDSASAIYYANKNTYPSFDNLKTEKMIDANLKPPKKYKSNDLSSKDYAIETEGDNIGRAYITLTAAADAPKIYSDTEWTN